MTCRFLLLLHIVAAGVFIRAVDASGESR